jgi:flagellar hook-associated protein FlgK
MDPIATAQYGMLAASRKFEASAFRVTAMGDANADVDLVSETVEQIGAQHAFAANISVIKTADRMVGDLLDIIA